MTNSTNTPADDSAYKNYVNKLYEASLMANEAAFEQVLRNMKSDASLNGCTINDIFQEKIENSPTILDNIIIHGGTGAIRLLDIATSHGLTITDDMLDNIQNLYNNKHGFSLTQDNNTQSQNFINILTTYAQQNPQKAYDYILKNFNKNNTGKKFFAELRLTLATAINSGAKPTIEGLELFCECQLAYADGNAAFIHRNENVRFDAYKTLKEAIKKYKENPNNAEIRNILIGIIDCCKDFDTSSLIGAHTNAELTALDKFKTMIVEGNTSTRTSTRTNPRTSATSPTPSPSVTNGPSNDVRHAKGTNTQSFWDKKFLGLSVRAWAWIIGGLLVGGLAYGAFRKGGWLNKDKGKSKLSSIASSGQSTGQGSTGSSQTPTLPTYQDSVTQQPGSGSTLETAGSVLTATSITGGIPPSHTR